MKKVLVFFAVFALLGTMAFAQDVTASGNIRFGLAGANGDADATTSNMEFGIGLGASKTNDDGTAGFKIGLGFAATNGQHNDDRTMINTDDGSAFGGSVTGMAYGWWRPIEQLYIKVGKNSDTGYWTGLGLLAWDLHSNDSNGMGVNAAFNYYNGFPGHVLGDGHAGFSSGLANGYAFSMAILPMDALAINVGFNFQGDNAVPDNYIDNTAIQVVYNLGIGTAAVGFRNAPEGASKQIAAQWAMQIDNMKIQAGIKYLTKPDGGNDQPIDIGVGFGLGSPWGDQFWLNSRLGVRLDSANKENIFGLDVVASYGLDIFRVYIPVGVGIVMKDGDDMALAWNFSPYIRKDLGGIELWTGLVLFNGPQAPWACANGARISAADDAGQINWKIPVAVQWVW